MTALIEFDPAQRYDVARIAHLVRLFPRDLWRAGQLLAYTGILGSGKTALMTLVGLCARMAGVPVYSNYDAQPAGFLRLQNMFDVFDLHSSLVLLDEIQHVGVDSRDSTAKKLPGLDPRFILYWFDLVRKDSVAVSYTTQDIGKVDLRVRQITGWILHSVETHVPHTSKVSILRYGGAEQAQQVGAFVWDRRVIYGAYNTRDKKVLLPLDPDGEPRSPFPTRAQLQDALAARSDAPPPARRGAAPARGRLGSCRIVRVMVVIVMIRS